MREGENTRVPLRLRTRVREPRIFSIFSPPPSPSLSLSLSLSFSLGDARERHLVNVAPCRRFQSNGDRATKEAEDAEESWLTEHRSIRFVG
jgi:hypothetical protein